ncbi:MAG: hypothetical protein K9G59_05860 [Caulobacter sp.]|nr:hypothetical protein [Caulobacter sp.]
MAPTPHRPEPGPFDLRDPSGRHMACLTGGCVWKRLDRLEREAEGATPIGRLLHAYYLDLVGICVCPHGRGGREI